MWEFKRKLLYALVTFVGILAIFVFLLRGVLFPEPTCTDGKKNGFEVNVDCGGTCSLICKGDIKPLTILWAKAVPSGKESYDLAALIANENIDNASREIGYTFTVYDKEGASMKIVSGSTTFPLDGKFPLIIQGVHFSKVPFNVAVVLNDGPHYKVSENPTSPTIKVLQRKYEAGSIPRVYATIVNTKRIDIIDLPVRVVLYDVQDNAYAVAQTIVPHLPKEGVQEIILTWHEPLIVSPTRIGVYPIFNPFKALPSY